MNEILALTGLNGTQFLLCSGVIFLAGMVRGFAGFALSALVMAALVTLLPPVELIVVCWFLEVAASFLMVRGGVKHWERSMVLGLLGGSIIGSPIGLYLTNTLPVETSKKVALILVLALAVLQLLKVRMAFLATPYGVGISGLVAGIVTGLASIGGMVVALYVLARDAPAHVMRASLVMFLALGSIASLVYLLGFGMMDGKAIARGLIWAPVCMAGVVAGKMMFRPSLERYYKPFCLVLLMVLAGVGLVRMGMAS